MRRKIRIARIALAAVLLLTGPMGFASAVQAQPASDAVTQLSLTGVVDPFVADYLRTGIRRAEETIHLDQQREHFGRTA